MKEVRLSPKTVREILGHDIGHSTAAGTGLRDDEKELRVCLRNPPEEVMTLLEERAPTLAQPDGLSRFKITPHKSGATTIILKDTPN